MITHLFDRYVSEANTNNKQYALEVLEGYYFIPSKLMAWNGRYIRYIDTKDTYDMKVKIGGFLVNDDKFTMVLKNQQRVFKVKKQNVVCFMLPNPNDRLNDVFKRVIKKLQ
jgi:hypothetical protein